MTALAAALLKRGIQYSLTFGNAKAVDLFAYNPRTSGKFTVQVKGVSRSNGFYITKGEVHQDFIYVFVIPNGIGEQVEYFVVPGAELLREPARFGKWLGIPAETIRPNHQGIHPLQLQEYKNRWEVFGQTPAP